MDWANLRSAGESWLDCVDTQGAHDLSHWAMDFIPDCPNDPADAEWLKERGWDELMNGRLMSPCEYLRFQPGKTSVLTLCGNGVSDNPTRMTVALFEAAAREAMKNGE